MLNTATSGISPQTCLVTPSEHLVPNQKPGLTATQECHSVSVLTIIFRVCLAQGESRCVYEISGSVSPGFFLKL